MWKIAKSLICEPIYLNNFETLISIYYVFFYAYKEMIQLTRIMYFRYRESLKMWYN